MRPRHRVSRAGIELIKRFEGYRRKAAQLPDGRWTVGYGHTLTAREGVEVSEADAEALLVYDLIGTAHLVNEQTFTPLNQNQFDALCSFAFNIGSDSFRRSQVLKRLNEGALVQAACAMEMWRKAEFEGERIVVDTLVRRRAAEKALYLTPTDDDFAPAPSPVLRPLVDQDARVLVPAETPATLTASLEGETTVVTREDTPAVRAFAPEPEEEAQALTAAAEAVAARLQTIFPDSDAEADPAPPAGPVVLSYPDAMMEAPVPTAEPAPPPEPEPAAAPEAAPPEFPRADPELAIPPRPVPRPEFHVDESAVRGFIPERTRPQPERREPGLLADLFLSLLGLAFFGFGLNARGGGLANPLLVAWTAGLAGVGFLVVAVFRLLERLGRIAERD